MDKIKVNVVKNSLQLSVRVRFRSKNYLNIKMQVPLCGGQFTLHLRRQTIFDVILSTFAKHIEKRIDLSQFGQDRFVKFKYSSRR